MIILPIENFLEHFEKKFDLKKKDLSEISSPILASFLRSPYTSLFLQYNPLGGPYGPNFFTGVKS